MTQTLLCDGGVSETMPMFCSGSQTMMVGCRQANETPLFVGGRSRTGHPQTAAFYTRFA